MPDLDPMLPARRDAEKLVKRVAYRATDFGKTYMTAALLKQLALGGVAVAAAAVNFPGFAFAACAVALVSLMVYAVYATKLLKAQDREIRWAWVDGKRVKQRETEAKIAMHTVTLTLMGERDTPHPMRGASHELRSALAFHRHQLVQAEARAEAAEAVKGGTATDSQRRTLKRFQRRDAAPPKGPAVGPIKRRREALQAEYAALEAEIRSLATAENVTKAMEAEEVKGARRTHREHQDAARKADQAARERVRDGRNPTPVETEHTITLGIQANGEQNASTGRSGHTPEQIARGEDATEDVA